jgi:hypothetical protein
MTRATCLVITVLLVLGCSAAFAQNVTLGFLDSDGVTQFCDTESLAISTPYAAGIHTQCGIFPDATLVGFRGSVLPVAHLPVTGGQTYMLADSGLDAVCNCFSGSQAMLITAATPMNPKKPKFGWEYIVNDYESFSPYVVVWGYLIPATDGPVAKGPANQSSAILFRAATRNKDIKQ